MLQAMFLFDPTLRPTASDVLEHPYFATEEPKEQRVWELEGLEGEWHEFESKALRKGKEREEREARKREKDAEKRKGEDLVPDGNLKKVKLERAAERAEAA